MIIENGLLLNYSYMFSFERNFSRYDTRLWMSNNWKMTFLYSAIYVTLIFSIKNFMKNRQKFELNGIFIIWNFSLATFSFIGLIRTGPEFLHVLFNYGIYQTICIPSFLEKDLVSGFWTWLFILSKLIELGDTIFVVLRKKPLIFLHWYHHMTVLLYGWFSYSELLASGYFRWFMVMNYFIHFLMYSYYTLRAAKFYIPRIIAMTITSLQILQMITGCIINVLAYQYLNKYGVENCQVSIINIRAASLMYFSYFLLFVNFFYEVYIVASKSKSLSHNNKKSVNDKLLNLNYKNEKDFIKEKVK